MWELKYGADYCDKLAKTYTISDATRAKFNQPSAVHKSEDVVFDATKMPKDFQQAVHRELSGDEVGIWNDAQIDQDLFPPRKHNKISYIWDWFF